MTAASPPSDRLRLVVPCFNEARRLDRAAFETALTDLPWLDVLFVNDGSTDHTADVVQAIATAWPSRVSVLSLTTNRGKAEAVRQGLLRASTDRAFCGFWDADLSAPLSELTALRDVFTREPNVEWVWGIRLKALGRHITRGALRHYLGRVFATVTSATLGIASYDTQCGSKLFRVTPLLQTVLSEPFRSRWIFDVEMLSRASALLRTAGAMTADELVYEQPLACWQHRAGSKVKPMDFVRALRELLVVRGQRSAWRRAMLTSGLHEVTPHVHNRD